MSGQSTTTLDLPRQQHYDGAFPLALQWQGKAEAAACSRYLGDNRDSLLAALGKHGAILFRGFPLASDLDFDRCIRAFGLPNFTYQESLSNAVRVNRTEYVFTANEAPPDVSIYLHHEMAQTPLFPSRLFFFCEHAPEHDGETPLCRSDVLLAHLDDADPQFVRNCAERGVTYTNVMPAQADLESGQGRSWRHTLGADTREDAEARLSALGYRWDWRDDDSLSVTTPVLPAIRRLRDGRRVFFNQLIAAFRGWSDARNDPSRAIRYGDGSPIPPASMQRAIDLGDELSFDLAWQTGDMALIDNFLVMHGRRPFTGKRRVLASLVADDGTRLAA